MSNDDDELMFPTTAFPYSVATFEKQTFVTNLTTGLDFCLMISPQVTALHVTFNNGLLDLKITSVLLSWELTEW